jgi:hypothetical protein
MMFKRAELMEVAWSKVGAIRRMLEDFPLENSQRLICLVGSMGTRVVMQEQHSEPLLAVSKYLHYLMHFKIFFSKTETYIVSTILPFQDKA